jgi:hypothetical protein
LGSNAQKSDGDHRRRGAASYIPYFEINLRGRREHVMTWASDRTGMLLYTMLGMLVVLSSVYLPA